ncbi:hypothetical protein [Marinobacterium sedimentorum]|uniref:hypothetical protein n=1 Tax=Marinobacterium sedimentorum TaxID=2927804 RepID=UPI0020C70740|nr:hypothetical protein [Marinobacterium sedimentorum]MCP8689226.1 hypothetical protein [Marinobacterium sedimentorum]
MKPAQPDWLQKLAVVVGAASRDEAFSLGFGLISPARQILLTLKKILLSDGPNAIE